jgi:hypothetical protein
MLRHTKCVQLAQADLLTVIRCVHRRSEAPNTQLFSGGRAFARTQGELPSHALPYVQTRPRNWVVFSQPRNRLFSSRLRSWLTDYEDHFFARSVYTFSVRLFFRKSTLTSGRSLKI